MDILTLEDEANVPSWNVRHLSPSDVPYARKSET